jgi:5-methyltetrahydrofolate--homocysteine methyltransferase
MTDLTGEIRKNIIAGRIDSEDEGFDGDMEGQPGVTELIEKAIDEDVPAENILTVLNEGMEEVGRLYEKGEYLIPDMLASAETVSTAMEILEPKLKDSNVETKGRFVIATVEGDLHDIGKNIVVTMLKGSGYEVLDLGTSVTVDKIIETVKNEKPQYLGLSALLTTTMGQMEEVIKKLEGENLRDNIKVFIGGAPISQNYCDKIHADYYCEDAFDALAKLEKETA